MKRFPPLLMLTGLLFGQDVLHLKSGEVYNGTFIRKVGLSSVVFQVAGENDSTKFPMRYVAMIKTSDGELTYPFINPTQLQLNSKRFSQQKFVLKACLGGVSAILLLMYIVVSGFGM